MRCARLAGLAMQVWLVAMGASAQPTARRALWVSRRIGAEDDQRLRAAVGRAGGWQLVGLDAIGTELERRAASLGADRHARAVEIALRGAREAYVELRLGQARDAYDRALAELLASDRAVTTAPSVASALFERALVALAAQRVPDAERDLLAAVMLDPSLAPDPAVYGPPVFRALDAARRRASRARPLAVRLDIAPADAIVRVDGAAVTAGRATVRGPGLHLLTVEQLGYVPRAAWIELSARAETRTAVVLERAQGGLLALQALRAWREARTRGEDAAAALSSEAGLVAARALGITHVIEAVRESDELALVARDATTGERTQTARGGRVEWEPSPYFVLAQAFEGRAVAAPSSSGQPGVAITVSAPSRVTPSSAIALQITVDDPGRRTAIVEGDCARRIARARMPASQHASLALHIDAPDAVTEVRCKVRALDAAGRALAVAPDVGSAIAVRVEEAEPPWYGRWYVWSAAVAVAAAGLAIGVVAAQSEPPDQILVIHGPP